MSSEMMGEEPAITEDSDLVDIIRELYRGRVGRNQKTSDFCVGGALCHYFLRDEADWIKRQPFPFPDSLAYDLDWIVRDRASEIEILPPSFELFCLIVGCGSASRRVNLCNRLPTAKVTTLYY